jgi:hypothetical protein
MTQKSELEKLFEELIAEVNKHEAKTLLQGKNFNIFSVLNLTTSEVGLHSILLAELLSPKGSHGQGSIFLKLFLEEINSPDLFNGLTNVKVEVEKYIGQIDENSEKGGRIDIFISHGNTCLVIENKINAGDQEKQLVRYDNYIKQYSKHEIIYLTPKGIKANSNSVTYKNGKTVKYKRVSYEANITKWLEKCVIELCDKNSIKEILIQYLEVVKKLTFQNENKMNTIIKSTIISKPEYIKTAFEISNSIHSLKQEILTIFYKKLGKKLSNYNIETNLKSLGTVDSSISISKDKWKNHLISIYFWGNYSDIIIGILHKENQSSTDKLMKSFLFEPLNDLGIGERINKLSGWIWVNTFHNFPQLKTPKEWSELIEDNTISEVSLTIEKIVSEVDIQIRKNIELQDF